MCKYCDVICRKCKGEIEDPLHIVNCGVTEKIDIVVDVENLGKLDEFTKTQLKLLTSRISLFLEDVCHRKSR